MIRLFCAALCVVLAVSGHAHGDIDARIALLSARIDDGASNPALYALRGDLYRQHEQWRAAHDDYVAAGKLGGTVADLDYRKGRALLGLGLPEKALWHFDRHLAHRPDDVRVLFHRSRAQSLLERWLDAAADLGQIQQISVSPSPEIFIARSRALLAAGPQYEGAAFANLQLGVERLGPMITLIRFAVATAQARARYDVALTWINQLPARHKQQATWLVAKADTLAQLNRHHKAAALYSGATKALRALPPTRRNTSAMRALEQRIADALAHVPSATSD